MFRPRTDPAHARNDLLGGEMKDVGRKLGRGAKSLAGRVTVQVSISTFRDSATWFLILHRLSAMC